MMQEIKIDISYIGLVLFSVLFTWELHEFAHWLTGEVLGNKMVMTLNSGYPINKEYLEVWHGYAIDLAGPLITFFQAFLVYFLIKRGASLNLFPFLFCCLYMRALAGFMNIINLNDEGRLSKVLGLGVFTLPIIISIILFYWNYKIIKTHRIKSRIVVVTLILIMVFSSLLILGDQFWKIRLL